MGRTFKRNSSYEEFKKIKQIEKSKKDRHIVVKEIKQLKCVLKKDKY